MASLVKQMQRDAANERALAKKMLGLSTTDSPTEEFGLDDETYEDIANQLEGFKSNPDQSELLLPSGMSGEEIRLAQMVAEKHQLKLVQTRKGDQWKVVK